MVVAGQGRTLLNAKLLRILTIPLKLYTNYISHTTQSRMTILTTVPKYLKKYKYLGPTQVTTNGGYFWRF